MPFAKGPQARGSQAAGSVPKDIRRPRHVACEFYGCGYQHPMVIHGDHPVRDPAVNTSGVSEYGPSIVIHGQNSDSCFGLLTTIMLPCYPCLELFVVNSSHYHEINPLYLDMQDYGPSWSLLRTMSKMRHCLFMPLCETLGRGDLPH